MTDQHHSFHRFTPGASRQRAREIRDMPLQADPEVLHMGKALKWAVALSVPVWGLLWGVWTMLP